MLSVSQKWRYVRYCVSFGRLKHKMPNCTPYAVSIHYFGSRYPYVDYCRASLCVLAPDELFLHTEQDWNFTRTCSRTYVSIITALMRTMKLLLAYVHHALNPQPKAMVFTTMSLCNHIPSPATVGYVVCYNQSALLLVSHSDC